MLLHLLINQLPMQPTSATLADVWRGAQRVPETAGTVTVRAGLAERTWETVRPARVYKVEDRPREHRYKYRIPPDWSETEYPKGAIVVESYLDGFPVYALRANGDEALARPLGFIYGADGICTNARLALKLGDSWTVPHVTQRGMTALIRNLALFENRYDDQPKPRGAQIHSSLWFKVEARGYGTYLFYKDLQVIGPGGSQAQLLSVTRQVIEEVLKGDWNKEPPQFGD